MRFGKNSSLDFILHQEIIDPNFMETEELKTQVPYVTAAGSLVNLDTTKFFISYIYNYFSWL